MIHIPRFIIYIIWTVITIWYLYIFINHLPEDEPTTKKVVTPTPQKIQSASAVETESESVSEIDQLKKENQELREQLKQLK